MDSQLIFGARRFVSRRCDVHPGEQSLVVIDSATTTVYSGCECLADQNVFHLVQLGTGMNPKAKLTGRTLDGEMRV